MYAPMRPSGRISYMILPYDRSATVFLGSKGGAEAKLTTALAAASAKRSVLYAPCCSCCCDHSMSQHSTPRKISKVAPSSIYEVGDPVLAPLPLLTDGDRGSDWLEDYDGLFVTTRLNMSEGSVKTTVAAIARGADIPESATSDWAYPLKAALDEMPALKAKEVLNALTAQTKAD